ncbi:MAG TPA: putative toxin-antitoxin system toxin component, PIN family [Ktedonobacterales bacterium]|nr:putative toxin-antitoxin system toxin component, PIN family [Ktedonobacterales bacterium]
MVDTNVIISALISKTGLPAKLLTRWEQTEAFDLVVSESILQEYQRAIAYQQVRSLHRLTPSQMEQFLARFRELAILVEPTEEVTVVERDRDDNQFIACALAGGAEYIVTGDDDLLSIKTYQGIRILSPATFLAFLEQRNENAA